MRFLKLASLHVAQTWQRMLRLASRCGKLHPHLGAALSPDQEQNRVLDILERSFLDLLSEWLSRQQKIFLTRFLRFQKSIYYFAKDLMIRVIFLRFQKSKIIGEESDDISYLFCQVNFFEISSIPEMENFRGKESDDDSYLLYEIKHNLRFPESNILFCEEYDDDSYHFCQTKFNLIFRRFQKSKINGEISDDMSYLFCQAKYNLRFLRFQKSKFLWQRI